MPVSLSVFLPTVCPVCFLPVYMYIRPACLHCNENHIYVFPEKEMCGRSPNFQILLSENNLYVPRIGPHIFQQQNEQTDRVNINIAHGHLNVEIGTVAMQAIPFLGIFVSNFRYCVFTVQYVASVCRPVFSGLYAL
jgi:hypothetical protein